MDDAPEQQYPDFEQMKTMARDMLNGAFDQAPLIIKIATVEQMRTSIREHMAKIECNPLDKDQLRAFTLGALFTIYRQAQYTPIGMETSIIPAITVDMLDAPPADGEVIDFERIKAMFEIAEPTPLEAQTPDSQLEPDPKLIGMLRGVLKVWDTRHKH